MIRATTLWCMWILVLGCAPEQSRGEPERKTPANVRRDSKVRRDADWPRGEGAQAEPDTTSRRAATAHARRRNARFVRIRQSGFTSNMQFWRKKQVWLIDKIETVSFFWTKTRFVWIHFELRESRNGSAHKSRAPSQWFPKTTRRPNARATHTFWSQKGSYWCFVIFDVLQMTCILATQIRYLPTANQLREMKMTS